MFGSKVEKELQEYHDKILAIIDKANHSEDKLDRANNYADQLELAIRSFRTAMKPIKHTRAFDRFCTWIDQIQINREE